jgi:hypothetical protein
MTDRPKSGGLPATPTSDGRGTSLSSNPSRAASLTRTARSGTQHARQRAERGIRWRRCLALGRSACLLRAFRPTNAAATPGVETAASGGVVDGQGYVARPSTKKRS